MLTNLAKRDLDNIAKDAFFVREAMARLTIEKRMKKPSTAKSAPRDNRFNPSCKRIKKSPATKLVAGLWFRFLLTQTKINAFFSLVTVILTISRYIDVAAPFAAMSL